MSATTEANQAPGDCFSVVCALTIMALQLMLTACAMTPQQEQALSDLNNSLAVTEQAIIAANQVPATKLMLFGGIDHRTYLGCLNCGQYAADSVTNAAGAFGNPYNAASIFDPSGDFGSSYSMYSVCNPLASDPPVIVDDAGNFYGRLTVNINNPQVDRDANTITWLTNIVCAH